MRVTQQDIARLAKVSQSTVSRVVAGDQRVEEEIRERVMTVMRNHNYRPDVRARSLRTQSTHLIGLVMKREARDLQGDPFFSMFVSEILGFLSSTPYHLCVDIAASALRQEFIYDELLRTRRVDGLILVESEPRDERVERLQKDAFPFVIIGNPGSDVDLHSVDNDNILAGEVATRHLVEQGYKRIGFLAGPASLTVSKDRIRGYANIMEEFGQKPRTWYSDFGHDAARRVALKALGDLDRPDALVVLDDFMAMGVIEAARELSLPLGSHLGLVSFNDSNLCQLVPGGLSSVSLNISKMVQFACEKLLSSIEGTNGFDEKRSIVSCELRARASSIRTPEVSLV